MKSRLLIAALVIAATMVMSTAQTTAKNATLTYFGRSSMQIVTANGVVICIDPYASGAYSKATNIVLVTHGHDDHNDVRLAKLAPGGIIAAPASAVSAKDAKAVKEGDEFTFMGVRIKAVAAYNKNHSRSECVGYLISFDGITVYHAGDTSYIPEMANLAVAKIDYAFFPTDGYWNMGASEARKCADAVKARFVCAIHSSPDGLYDKAKAEALAGKDVITLPPGTTIELKPTSK